MSQLKDSETRVVRKLTPRFVYAEGQSAETSGLGQCTIHNKPDYRNNVNRSLLEGAAKRQCTRLIP